MAFNATSNTETGMYQSTTLTDQIANISPVWVVGLVLAFTLVRVLLAKVTDTWAKVISEICDTVNFVLILAFLLVKPFVAQAFYIPSESMESTLLKGDRLIVDKFSYRFRELKRGDVVVFNAPPDATPEHRDGIDFIKRLIAVPGDTLQIKSGEIRVNGESLTPQSDIHPYLKSVLGLPEESAVKLFDDYLLVDGTEKIDKEMLAEKLGVPGSKIEIVPGQTILNGKVQPDPYTREDPGYDYPGDGKVARIEDGKLFMMGDNRNRSQDSHAWGQLPRERVVGHAVFKFWPPQRMGPIK